MSRCVLALEQGVMVNLVMDIIGGNMGRKIFWGLITQGETLKAMFGWLHFEDTFSFRFGSKIEIEGSKIEIDVRLCFWMRLFTQIMSKVVCRIFL